MHIRVNRLIYLPDASHHYRGDMWRGEPGQTWPQRWSQGRRPRTEPVPGNVGMTRGQPACLCKEWESYFTCLHKLVNMSLSLPLSFIHWIQVMGTSRYEKMWPRGSWQECLVLWCCYWVVGDRDILTWGHKTLGDRLDSVDI